MNKHSFNGFLFILTKQDNIIRENFDGDDTDIYQLRYTV
jgi:hypothetical protein